MSKAEIIRNLRIQTGIVELPAREVWKAPCFDSGVAKGIVAELTGNAKAEWLLSLFSAFPEPYILWCDQDHLVSPTAIKQRGVKLERIKFVTADDLHQPIRLALECGYYPFVVAPSIFTEIRTLQRFQLVAEKTQSTLFLLAQKDLSQAWPISLQLEVTNSDTGFNIEVHRQKYSGAT